ncbi:MAG: allophanate hydrolase subunit 1, partial [Zetaproteobacteria bacterium]|nr:allophanate hydrolase subunit 1 [Flavobacteriales bacterium]
MNPSFKAFGSKAILIEWPPQISETILLDILLFKQKIESRFKGFYDLTTAYNSLTIFLQNPITDFDKQVAILKNIYQTP